MVLMMSQLLSSAYSWANPHSHSQHESLAQLVYWQGSWRSSYKDSCVELVEKKLKNRRGWITAPEEAEKNWEKNVRRRSKALHGESPLLTFLEETFKVSTSVAKWKSNLSKASQLCALKKSILCINFSFLLRCTNTKYEWRRTLEMLHSRKN